MLLLLAQDIGVGGLAGWSSFGIAGLVLGWLLLIYLPRKDRETQEIVRDAAARQDARDTEHIEHIREQRADFRASLQTVVDHCERQAAVLRDTSEKDVERVLGAVKEMAASVREAVRCQWGAGGQGGQGGSGR